MPKAICFGTFDGLHEGHRHFLKEASTHGELRVVVALDATVVHVKGRPPLHNENARLKALQEEGYEAVLGNHEDKYAVIETYRPDTIILGYDQAAFTDRLKPELLKRGIEARIIRLKAYEPDTFKSSKLNSHPHQT